MSLKDTVCVITGAGRNIGRGMAERLVADGANVAVVDLDETRGRSTAETLSENDAPGEARFFQADVTDADAVRGVREGVLDEWGRVDGLVNNVAYAANKSVVDCSVGEWDRVLDITLKSAFLCTKFLAPAMADTGGGAIVNVASTSAHRGTPQKVAYCSAKGGLLNFTRQTAVDLAESNIRVNTLSPTRTGGAVGHETGGPGRHTAGILRNRLGEPVDHANAVAFLLSEEADFITGTELVVDGGTLATMPSK